ncbi:MAG: hypothetical protein ACLP3K_07345 [Candidatus Acidiferrales bacterium]
MATSRPPLDPRKFPWHRGDVVTRGFEKNGFVLDATPEYLEVMWQGPGHNTERLTLLEADNLVRVGHASSLSAGDEAKTNLEVLETLLALDRMKEAMQRRMSTIKTKEEETTVNSLIQRSFDKEGCAWDLAHRAQLFRLAVEPSNVGWMFKIQERLHRRSCKRHQATK